MNNQASALLALKDEIEQTEVAPHLKETATQLVFGAGSPSADIVFVGEAPGKHEDVQGIPFVGASGKLLDAMLETIELARKDIYITNIVKYRPPDNRDPTPQEIEAFRPYLLQQIAIIKPKIVVFLGRHSMGVFLPELKIGEAHGNPVVKDGRVYLPLYHPAAALYNGSMRQTLLEDFAKIPAILKQIPDPSD